VFHFSRKNRLFIFVAKDVFDRQLPFDAAEEDVFLAKHLKADYLCSQIAYYETFQTIAQLHHLAQFVLRVVVHLFF
jgi:hypothetical protein